MHGGIKLRPHRCMRGGTTSTTPTNLGGLALYNNSTGAELLALWTINVGSANTATSGMGLFQGKPQGSALTTSPLVSGESIRAGQLVQIDSTTNYLVDYPTTFVSGMPDYLDPGLPYAEIGRA